MSMRFLAFSMLLFLAAMAVHTSPSLAASEFLVAEWGANAISRIADLNGDGDALDVAERTLWASTIGAPKAINYGGNSLFVVDSGPLVYRYTDLNLDGDALDLGEHSTFAAGFDSPAAIQTTSTGRIYVSESQFGEVWQLLDANGDGDALDLGERSLFAVGIFWADDIILFENGLLVSTNFSNDIHRIIDINNDGDALDVGENQPIAHLMSSGVGGTRGLLEDGAGGLFATSSPTGTVSHFIDLNGDGDMLDIGEVQPYADSIFGTLSAPGALARLDGAILASDASLEAVTMIVDLNGDGDALDLGESIIFADDMATPVDIAAAPLRLFGDYNNDGIVDAADYVLFRKLEATTNTLVNDAIGGTIGPAQYDQWRTHFRETAGNGAPGATATALVPEPSSGLLLIVAAAALIVKRSLAAHGASPCQHANLGE